MNDKLEVEDQQNYPDYADYIMLKLFDREWNKEVGGWVQVGDQSFTPQEAAKRTRERYKKGANWIPSYIESTKIYKMMSQKFQGSLSLRFDENLLQVAAEGINDMNWAQEKIKGMAENRENFEQEKYWKGDYIYTEYKINDHVNAIEKVGKFGAAKAKMYLESKRSKEDAPIAEIKMTFNNGAPLIKNEKEKKELPVRVLRLDQVEKQK